MEQYYERAPLHNGHCLESNYIERAIEGLKLVSMHSGGSKTYIVEHNCYLHTRTVVRSCQAGLMKQIHHSLFWDISSAHRPWSANHV